MKKNLLISCALAVALVFTSVTPAFAYSSTCSSRIPGLDSTHSIESDIWMSNTYFYQTQSFQVSAYYHGYNPANANWIKTAWNISATGVGVSISGVSGSTGGNSFSGTWTNTNAYISSWSGTYNIGGVPLYGNGSNTASLLVSGVTASSSASIFRWY